MSDNFLSKMTWVASRLGATVKSLLKVVAAGGGQKITPRVNKGVLIILGNGPSLTKNLDEEMEFLRNSDTLAVNFAANTYAYKELRPKFYVLADPHFFENKNDCNVTTLMGNIGDTSWDMTLFIPKGAPVPACITMNSHITVERFSMTGFESFAPVEHFAFKHGWGLPRPRNVLIPSIMIGLGLGYKEIFILGADHTWTTTLSVDEENHVVSVQPHFYNDNDKEKSRVTATYRDVRLHEILESFSIAFKSYHIIRRYADAIGAHIYNSTPGSFIDAFERKPLPK